MDTEQLLEEIKYEQECIQVKCLEINMRIAQCIEDLNNKALKTGSEDQYLQYIEELIEQ